MKQGDARDGRDRIRDAAIGQFARLGYAGASVRSIAAEAGVTPGLIVHHFGTKSALRDACDERVLDVLLGSSRSTDPAVLASRLADDGPVPYVTYLTSMLQAEPARADAVFDVILRSTREAVRQQRSSGLLADGIDDDALAALLAVYGLAPLFVPRQLARAFGGEHPSADALERAADAMAAVLTHGAYRRHPFTSHGEAP